VTGCHVVLLWVGPALADCISGIVYMQHDVVQLPLITYPLFIISRSNFAFAYSKMKNWEKVLDCTERGLAHDTGFGKLWYRRALALQAVCEKWLEGVWLCVWRVKEQSVLSGNGFA
jgi:hypothetical protein